MIKLGDAVKVTGGRFRKRIVSAVITECRKTTFDVSYEIPGVETGNAVVRIDGRGAHIIQ